MPISVGDPLPAAHLLTIGDTGPEQVSIAEHAKGRKIAVFGMPGAFTGTCSGSHMPAVIAAMPQLKDKGVDEVMVVVVNDPFVAQAWAKDTGADAAGVNVLADAAAELTTAMGLAFDAPPVGFKDRSQRYGMLVDDGVVTVLNTGDAPGDMALSSPDALLKAM